MPFLSRFFGKSPAPAADPEHHKGFTITPTPIREGGQFRVSARIEKEVGGEVKVHTLIRADTYGAADAAAQASVDKARMLIDEQGEGIFH